MMLNFKPWGYFAALLDRSAIRSFLLDVARTHKDKFEKGVYSPPKTGRLYKRKNGVHQASRAGEYPANETGRLAKSFRSRIAKMEAEGGSTVFYGKFLREGTTKMARRRMSDDALIEAIPEARGRMRTWARWDRK